MEVRKRSAEILYELEKKEAYLNILLRNRLPSYDLSVNEKHLITELVYGVTRWRDTLDFIWRKYVKKDNLSLYAKVLLRLVVYHVYFIRNTILPIVINEIVEIAKEKAPKEVKLINAVARRIIENRNNLDLNSFPEYLKYGIPDFILDEWDDYLGTAEKIKIASWSNRPQRFSVRVNTLKTNKEDLKKELIKRSIDVEDGYLVDQALIVKNGFFLENLDLFKEGYFIVQSEASMLPALILNPKPGEKVIDLCSAPGLKSTHMAELMKNEGKIVSVDINKNRLKLVEENAKRLGVKIIETLNIDATSIPESFNGIFDKVLLDAPCTGLGVLNHKPEIKWRLAKDQIYESSKLQLKLLEKAGKLVKRGGKILYSTCTLTWSENEGVVLSFLQNNTNFILERFSYRYEEFNGIFRVLPYKYKTDGFFISLLSREY